MTNAQQKTILITGGHLTPAIALIQALKASIPEGRIVYVGRDKYATGQVSVEKNEVTRLGVIYRTLVSGKLYRYPTMAQLKEMLKMPLGLILAAKLLIQEKPDAVVSFGGFLSVPIVIMAWMMREPVIIHEQTTVLGAANRFTRRLARVVAVSWPHQQTDSVVLTGNPIPQEILSAHNLPRLQTKRPILVVTEGSQGSKVISAAINAILPALLEKFVVYHQTPYPSTTDNPNYHSQSWFSLPEYAQILKSASLAVSRSGANTVTYHAYLGVPSIFIPLDIAAGNEQMENARLLQQIGLARIIPQAELTPERLMEEIEDFEKSLPEEKEIAAKAEALVRPDAAKVLAEIVVTNINI